MRVLQIFTYLAVEKGMENNGRLQQNHDASTRAASVGEKAHLGTKQHQTVQNQARSLYGYQVTLVLRH